MIGEIPYEGSPDSLLVRAAQPQEARRSSETRGTPLVAARPRQLVVGATLVVTIQLLLSASALADVAHDARTPEILSVRVGFDGHYKVGYWTPIEVRLRAGTIPAIGTVEVVVPDCDNVPTIVPASIDPIEIDAGEERTVWLAAKIGRELEDLDVRFSLANGSRVKTTFTPGEDGIEPWHALAPGERLYLTLGGDVGIPRTDNESRPVTAVHFRDTSHLPQRWYGYDAVDAAVIAADDAMAFPSFGKGNFQYSALVDWIQLRGKLVLSIGSAARELLTANAQFANLAPGDFHEVQPLRRVDAIEKYADSAQRIPLAARSSSTPLEVARLDSPKGLVVVEEGDLPLVIRSPRGFGEIMFVAFDLGRRPISDWAGRGKFVGRLLGWNEAGLAETNRPNRGTPLGFSDLSGQLHAALDQFEGVRVIPFWIVGLSIAGYVLLIGPVDYLVVCKFLKRPQLTWVTFPVLTLLIGGLAYGAARWTKGNDSRLNQVSVIDFDSSASLVRGATWSSLFSPQGGRFDLTFEGDGSPEDRQLADPPPKSTLRPVNGLISWFGSPGFAWGAMQSQDLGTGSADEPYRFYSGRGSLDGLFGELHQRRRDARDGLPDGYERLIDITLATASVKEFEGRWHDSIPAPCESRLYADDEGRLSGELSSRLEVDLKDCLLVYGRWAYPLGDLLAGGKREIAPESRRDLQSVLRGARSVKQSPEQGFAFEAKPYDVTSLDVPEILRQMMFYRAAEGRAYTTLTNDYQGFVDLSHQLELGRAVLVGQLAAAWPPSWHVGEESSSGSTEHRGHRWTFYRFIFDVEQPK